MTRPLGRNKDSDPFGYPVARTEGTPFGAVGLFICSMYGSAYFALIALKLCFMNLQNHNLLFISNNGHSDPAYNLALEEYAVRNLPPENDYLLLYVNNPSVILGKHQNVAEEVNQRYCTKNNIPILRRISGGGAVYHDSGNLNFSFITAHTLKKFNNYSIFIKPILEILQGYDNEVRLDESNNLVLRGKKLSGNAQFTSRGRMVSHGTLLFKTDLKHLQNSLKIDPGIRVESRSTKSQRSSVANLNDFNVFRNLSIVQFKQALLNHIFRKSISRYQLSKTDNKRISELAFSRYCDWEWNYGRSPASKVSKKDLELEIVHGRISKIESSISMMTGFNPQVLIGQKYDYSIIKSFLNKLDVPSKTQIALTEQILSLLF